MKCEQFRELLKLNPSECTAAERSAHFAHYHSCKECADVLNSNQLPLLLPLLTNKECIELFELAVKDFMDPECCNLREEDH